MDAPSYQDLFRIARDEMLAKNPKITLEVIEREGTDLNAICSGIAACADEVVAHNTVICAANMLDSARGQKLTRYVFDKYNIPRKPASVSLGSVVFSWASAAAVGFAISAGTKLVTTDGRQFEVTTSVSVTAGATSTSPVAVRSLLAGLEQQAQKNTITNILDAIPLAPTDISVTNALATAGADDEESDEDLRSRARNYFSTVAKGTISAIEIKALAYPGIRKAKVIEVLDAYGRPVKALQLIIADAFTDTLVDTASVAYDTQSQVISDAVFASLSDTRSAGIYVDVFLAQVILHSVVLALSFTADADVEVTALRARAAIVAYTNELSSGESWTRAGAIDKLDLVPGLLITGDEILSPAGASVVPAQRQVLRTTLGLVRASTVQPDRALQGTTNSDAVS